MQTNTQNSLSQTRVSIKPEQISLWLLRHSTSSLSLSLWEGRKCQGQDLSSSSRASSGPCVSRKERDINYPRVADLAQKLKGIGSSIGGCRVAAACVELRQASNVNHKQRGLVNFDAVKREYLVLRENLNHIPQMERTVNANEPKRRRE